MKYNEKKEAVRQWRESGAQRAGGTVPKGCHGDATYLGFPSIGFGELDNICDELNAEWKDKDEGWRVGWSMGEFMPGFQTQRQLPL